MIAHVGIDFDPHEFQPDGVAVFSSAEEERTASHCGGTEVPPAPVPLHALEPTFL